MQALTDATRGATAAQVTALIRDASSIQLAAGMEIVDIGLNVLDDVSDDLVGGEVGRNSYNVLHGDASFKLTRELDWGAGLVRPYLLMSGYTPLGQVAARFNLGVYHLTVPSRVTGGEPWDVGGFDMLLRLDDPVGDAYAIAAGDSYLAKVEEILLGRGYTQYVINPLYAGTIAPTDRTWAFDDGLTWLTVVNDMLSSIGYSAVWSDWDGRLRIEPYVLPQMRAVEWTYDDAATTGMLDPQRTYQRDYTDAPNRWVIYRSNNIDDVAPVEGAGIVTIQNDAIGDTSVAARGGRVITKVQGEDVADQGSLIARANQIAQTDMDIPRVLTANLPVPNPLHWHFDRNLLRLPEYFGDVQCTEWRLTLPPELADMPVTFREISQ
jgi:hypothetical protein